MTARRTSAPGPLSASRRGGTVALVAMLACCVAGPARAQDSQFGIKGLGTPGRMEGVRRSEEHTSELQSQSNLVCRLLLEKKKNKENNSTSTGLYSAQT